MVDVQQRALRTLEQDAAAGVPKRGQLEADVADQRLDAFGLGQRFLQHLLEVDGTFLEIVLQHEVAEIQQLAEFRREALAVEQVGHPDGTPGHLVLVGRADAAPGGADRARAARPLASEVQRDVRRQYQRAIGADAQSLEDRHAARGQHVRFLQQRGQRQHDAVADEALHALVQDAGGNQRQDRLLPAYHQRVTGVVTTLEAGDARRPLRQQVDDLALALVAPLRADDDDHPAHVSALRGRPRAAAS